MSVSSVGFERLFFGFNETTVQNAFRNANPHLKVSSHVYDL